MPEIKLKPCPFCGGEIEERGGLCNYEKKIFTLDLKCKKCGTIFKFKSKWNCDPYREAVEAWNRRVDNVTEAIREFAEKLKALVNQKNYMLSDIHNDRFTI